MIIYLTSRCNGNCVHCMSRCTEDGIDITQKIFEDSVKFIKKLDANVIMISGGEPTMHPDFISFLNYIKQELQSSKVILCSNGTFVRNPQLFASIKNSGILVQVTYNKDLYKTDLTDDEITQLSEIGYIRIDEPDTNRLVSYGRALDNKLETSKTRVSPFCFNIRSLIKNANMNFTEAIQFIATRGKFCSPGIKPDGSINISESLCCTSVGTIYDTTEQLTENIKNFHCTECIYAKELCKQEIYKSVFL